MYSYSIKVKHVLTLFTVFLIALSHPVFATKAPEQLKDTIIQNAINESYNCKNVSFLKKYKKDDLFINNKMIAFDLVIMPEVNKIIAAFIKQLFRIEKGEVDFKEEDWHEKIISKITPIFFLSFKNVNVNSVGEYIFHEILWDIFKKTGYIKYSDATLASAVWSGGKCVISIGATFASRGTALPFLVYECTEAATDVTEYIVTISHIDYIKEEIANWYLATYYVINYVMSDKYCFNLDDVIDSTFDNLIQREVVGDCAHGYEICDHKHASKNKIKIYVKKMLTKGVNHGLPLEVIVTLNSNVVSKKQFFRFWNAKNVSIFYKNLDNELDELKQSISGVVLDRAGQLNILVDKFVLWDFYINALKKADEDTRLFVGIRPDDIYMPILLLPLDKNFFTTSSMTRNKLTTTVNLIKTHVPLKAWSCDGNSKEVEVKRFIWSDHLQNNKVSKIESASQFYPTGAVAFNECVYTENDNYAIMNLLNFTGKWPGKLGIKYKNGELSSIYSKNIYIEFYDLSNPEQMHKINYEYLFTDPYHKAIKIPIKLIHNKKAGQYVVRITHPQSREATEWAILNVGNYFARGNSTSVNSNNLTSLFTRNLTIGSRGEDVKRLQKFLNSKGFIVNSTGLPGSPGMETEYFGPATKRALARYQLSRGIYPALGYFGPKTRAVINKEISNSTSVSTQLISSGLDTTNPDKSVAPQQRPEDVSDNEKNESQYDKNYNANVVAFRLNVRDSIQGNIIGVVSRGTKGQVLETKPDKNGNIWHKIKYSNGLVGWSAGVYRGVTYINTDIKTNDIKAEKFINRHYYKRCHGDDLYWYDTNGNRTDKIEICEYGCSNSKCKLEPKSEKQTQLQSDYKLSVVEISDIRPKTKKDRPNSEGYYKPGSELEVVVDVCGPAMDRKERLYYLVGYVNTIGLFKELTRDDFSKRKECGKYDFDLKLPSDIVGNVTIKVKVSTDQDFQDNVYTAEKTIKIRALEKTDFYVKYVSVRKSSIDLNYNDTKQYVYSTLCYRGEDPEKQSTRVKYFLSKDAHLGNGDILVDTESLGVWRYNRECFDEEKIVRVPKNLSGGKYYMIVFLDADDKYQEINEENNTGYADFFVLEASNEEHIIIKDIQKTSNEIILTVQSSQYVDRVDGKIYIKNGNNWYSLKSESTKSSKLVFNNLIPNTEYKIVIRAFLKNKTWTPKKEKIVKTDEDVSVNTGGSGNCSLDSFKDPAFKLCVSAAMYKEKVSDLNKLSKLDCSSFYVRDISNISCMPNLTYVKFGKGNINALPQEIFTLSKLKTLYLSNLNIRDLPINAFQLLPNLDYLSINDNPISVIKKNTFTNMSKIRYIRLFDNQISHIENGAFVNLPNLSSVALNGNKLQIIEPGAFQNINNSANIQLLENDNLTCIPIDLRNFTVTLPLHLRNTNPYCE